MEYVFSDRLKNLEGNAIREIFKLISQPDMISFAGGLPATVCLPMEQIKAYMDELMVEKNRHMLLQYGETEGFRPLRQTITEYVKKVGINDATLDNTLILSGGQQGIDLLFKAFINKGDVVLVENPTYLACLHILKTYEGKPVGVNSFDDGIDEEDLINKIKEYKPKIFYIVPNFSNPTGKTLSEAKRKRIVDVCAENNVLILEDDPYGKLRFEGNDLKAMKAFDRTGNVVYISSFSKTVSPGMRVGFAVGDEKIIRKMTIGKQAVDVHTPTLNQAIVNEFIKGDVLEKHVAKCLPIYKEKKDFMIQMLEKYMPKSFKFTRPEGGIFIWGEFDKEAGIDTVKMFRKVVQKKVAYVDGTSFFADGTGSNTLRFNFTNATMEQIEIGVKAMAEVFNK